MTYYSIYNVSLQIYLYSFRVIEEHDYDEDDDNDSTKPVSKNIPIPTNQSGAGIKKASFICSHCDKVF